MNVKIKYPTFKLFGTPTPNEKFIVCSKCGYSMWVNHGINVSYCPFHCGRMRNGTRSEYVKAKVHLKTVVGGTNATNQTMD